MGLELLRRAVDRAEGVPTELKETVKKLAWEALSSATKCSPETFLKVHYTLSAIERLYDELLSPVAEMEPPRPDALDIIRSIGEGQRAFLTQIAEVYKACARRK